MGTLLSFKEKRREKQLTYERKMLREISLTEIKKTILNYFNEFFQSRTISKAAIEEGCIDFAVEAFLLGAKFSRFGYYGESMQMVAYRCRHEEKLLTDDFFDYMLHWGKVNDDPMINESLMIACECYIQQWWKEGYTKGEKRYKLRLQ
ncbi:DUF2521 family protein [Metabacillus arenae]|uniref:DUF2521 family protein n=1 Tax=Metabacillus arenae TaxID=2771434 RepID=A0A926NL39_9BACI|nr:DUF2521 family protein [Metabacillus arenae]MBD1382725.1 DUF2521 family protein [Metabacillus arenae]